MHKDWCGKPCAECPNPCAIDENMSCSPDCEHYRADYNSPSYDEVCKACDACTTIEWCPHCECEVEMPAYKPANCINCGEYILPCSTCERVQDCDWDGKKGCSVYPRN